MSGKRRRFSGGAEGEGGAGGASRGSNPPKLTRFLSLDEIERLHATLDACVAERPSREPKADIIRLLPYAGCRRSEIQNPRWKEVGDGLLDLTDSKTGPRRVFLNRAARTLIDRQPRSGSPHVFPSPSDPARPRPSILAFWHLVRRRSAIDDARCHDLSHRFMSEAILTKCLRRYHRPGARSRRPAVEFAHTIPETNAGAIRRAVPAYRSVNPGRLRAERAG